MKTFYDPTVKMQEANAFETDHGSLPVLTIGGQEILMEAARMEITPETVAFLYIGAETAHLDCILMRYSAVDCFSYHPKRRTSCKEGASVNRALMRRYGSFHGDAGSECAGC